MPDLGAPLQEVLAIVELGASGFCQLTAWLAGELSVLAHHLAPFTKPFEDSGLFVIEMNSFLSDYGMSHAVLYSATCLTCQVRHCVKLTASTGGMHCWAAHSPCFFGGSLLFHTIHMHPWFLGPNYGVCFSPALLCCDMHLLLGS